MSRLVREEVLPGRQVGSGAHDKGLRPVRAWERQEHLAPLSWGRAPPLPWVCVELEAWCRLHRAHDLHSKVLGGDLAVPLSQKAGPRGCELLHKRQRHRGHVHYHADLALLCGLLALAKGETRRRCGGCKVHSKQTANELVGERGQHRGAAPIKSGLGH